MSTRPRAPGRAGKAAAVAAAGVVEASAVDPFSFDGSQDELLGAVVEAGAAPETLNQALQQAGAAAPGPSPRLVSPTAASKAASRDTPGRPSPSPRAARQKRSSQGGGAADAARPDGGGGEEDPFCFDASDTAKRFENLPPDLPAATRVTAAAVKRVTWGESTVKTLERDTPPARGAERVPLPVSRKAPPTARAEPARADDDEPAAQAPPRAAGDMHDSGTALAALDDVRFCMDGMAAAAASPASRASSAAEVATHLADPACRRAVRTQRLWAPLLHAAASMAATPSLRLPAACVLCLLTCCERLSTAEAEALAQEEMVAGVAACLTLDTNPAQDASRFAGALRRARVALSPPEMASAAGIALLVCDTGCCLMAQSSAAPGGAAALPPRAQFKALLLSTGALSSICARAHAAAHALCADAPSGGEASQAGRDDAAAALARCTRVLEHVCFEAEACAQHVLTWTPPDAAFAHGQVLPALCSCLAPLARRAGDAGAPACVGAALRSALAVVTNVTNERPQAGAALLACGGVASLAQLLRPLSESVLQSQGGPSAAHADALNAALCALANAAEVCPPVAGALSGEHLQFVATLFAQAHALTTGAAPAQDGGEGEQAAPVDGDNDVTLEALDAAERSAAAVILAAYCALLLACLLHAGGDSGGHGEVAACQATGSLEPVVATVERFLLFHTRINTLSPTAEATLREAVRSMRAWQQAQRQPTAPSEAGT